MEKRENYEAKIEHRFENKKAYNQFIDKFAGENYVQSRDIGRGKKKEYMPIPFQEGLADMCFSEWAIIREDYTVIVNELLCTVTVSYVPDFPGAQERLMTGTACKAIQQDSGSVAGNFPAGKKKGSLEYNAPAARKAAIGNALEQIGNIFGRNIGRETKDYKIEPDFNFRQAEEGGSDE